jgi:hypothetical protein
VVAFATKLEGLVAELRKNFGELIGQEELEINLRDQFHGGLIPSLKEAIRHRYDDGDTYEELLQAARLVEGEVKPHERPRSHFIPTHPVRTKKASVFSAAQVEEEEDMDETLREEDYEDKDVDEDEQLVQRIVASTKAAILKARGGKDDYQKKSKGSSHGGANREETRTEEGEPLPSRRSQTMLEMQRVGTLRHRLSYS